MPIFTVELSNGSKVDIEADHEPTEQEVLQAVQPHAAKPRGPGGPSPETRAAQTTADKAMQTAKGWQGLAGGLDPQEGPLSGRGVLNTLTGVRPANWLLNLAGSPRRIPEFQGGQMKPGFNPLAGAPTPSGRSIPTQTTLPLLQGLEKSVGEITTGLTDPNTWMQAAAFMVPGSGLANVARAGVAGEAISQIPQQAQQLAQTLQSNAPPEEKWHQGFSTGAQWVIDLLMGKGVRAPEVKPSGITPTENPYGAKALLRDPRGTVAEMIDELQKRVPPDRQLPYHAQSPADVHTLPSSGEKILLPERMDQSRFAVAPSGQTVDLSQLTPAEQAELMRTPPQSREVSRKQYEPTYIVGDPQMGEVPVARPREVYYPENQIITPQVPRPPRRPFPEGSGQGVPTPFGPLPKSEQAPRPLMPEGTPEEQAARRRPLRTAQEKTASGRQSLHSGVPFDLSSLRNREKELRGETFALTGPRLAAALGQMGFKNQEKEVDVQQAMNRIVNKVTPDEAAIVKQTLQPLVGQKKSPAEIAKLLQESGPRVEVRKLQAVTDPGQIVPATDQAAEAQHFLETRGYQLRPTEGGESAGIYRGNQEVDYRTLNNEEQAAFHTFVGEGFDTSSANESATARYQSVNPKPLSEMPGAVDLLVRVPFETFEGSLTKGDKLPVNTKDVKFSSSHYPTEGKNLLAHVRGYMETLPDGRKVFHVFEVQSDWAQAVREAKEDGKRTDTPWQSVRDDPLLRHYERLALKAAIDHAKREGADAVAVSDAETAMMSEGHDKAESRLQTSAYITPQKSKEAAMAFFETQVKPRFPEAQIIEVFKSKGGDTEGLWELNFVETGTLQQEKGMRLHYDQLLPRIAEELTGQKGERVEFGEHQNAFQKHTDAGHMLIEGPNLELEPNGKYKVSNQRTGEVKEFATHDEAWNYAEQQGKTPRKDLIFTNPDGSPKTTITARMYPIEKVQTPFGVFDKDKASNRGQYLYSGVPLPDLQKSFDKLKGWLTSRSEVEKAEWTPFYSKKEMESGLLKGEAQGLRSLRPSGPVPSANPVLTAGEKAGRLGEGVLEGLYKTYNTVNKGDKMYSPVDVIMDAAEGGKARFDGPLFKYVRWPGDFLFNTERNMATRLIDPVQEAVKRNKLTANNAERIGLHQAVMQGLTERLVENGIPLAQIEAVEKSLTPAELEVYRLMDKQYQDMFPAVARVAKEQDNIDLAHVDHYAPLQRDWRKARPKPDKLVDPRGTGEQDDAVDFLKADYAQAKPDSGFLIERLPKAKSPFKLNAFDVYERHVRDYAHYVTSRAWLKETSKVVRDQRFQDKYGDITQAEVVDWLNNYAKQGRTQGAAPLLESYRKALAKGVLGFRVASQFVHLANVPLGVQRAGMENYARGLQAVFTDEGQAFLQKHFQETYARGGGELELLEKQGPVSRAAFATQRALDKINSQATALGVYQKLLAEQGKDPTKWAELPPNQELIARARVETRRAVASPLYKDLPPLLRTQAGKVFAQFQNTFMDQWSNMRYDFPKYVRNDPKRAMGLFIALASMVAIESGVKFGAKKGEEELVTKATGKPSTRKTEKTYLDEVEQEAVRRIPGASQAMAILKYDKSGVPVIDSAMEVKKTVSNLMHADEKTKNLARVQAGTAALESVGALGLSGVPGVGQASEIVQESMKRDVYQSMADKVAKLSAGKSLEERAKLEQQMRKAEPPKLDDALVRTSEAVAKAQIERRKSLNAAMSPESQQWVKQQGLKVVGYNDRLKYKRNLEVTLTTPERQAYEQLIAQKHEETIQRLQKNTAWKGLSPEQKAVDWNKEMLRDNHAAEKEFINRLESGWTTQQDKERKGFSIRGGGQ